MWSARSSSFTDELEENLATGKGLWLIGNTGTGKTTLAMLVAKTALAAGRLGRDLLRPEAPGPDPQDVPGEPSRETPTQVLRAG